VIIRLKSLLAAALFLLAIFEGRSQSPLTAAEERNTFRLADTNLTIELVASEPAVRAPVAVAWDADGRMFVAEMTDYPSGPVSGRIRLLEDLDGDGRYERNTVFATNLAFPNGVMPWNNGVLVTAAPDIWFLADTNGDGVADVRVKVLTGFTEGNQQLRVNGLFWGLDNWIYGANGRSDGEARWADSTSAAAGNISIRRHDFRFRPDTKELEAIAGHSQFGMGHDDWGNRFPVFNNMPIRHVVMEDRYINRQPLLAGVDVVPSISPMPDGNRVFALTPPALLIPQPVGFFTSACGPSIYRGTTLPRTYQGNYFVCEPVQNVVQRRVLVPNGSTFVATYAHTNEEFLRSSDPWFHGVFTATGPEGALYVVDFYRQWVEHPHWVAPELRDKVDWRKGEEHGRIWRVVAKGARTQKAPSLLHASDGALVKALESENGWMRDTAQRLLVERKALAAVPALEQLARRRGATAQSRLHALYALQALGALSPPIVLQALGDPYARLRENGLRLAEQMNLDSKSRKNFESRLHSLSEDPDGRVRLQLAATLAGWPESDIRLTALARLAAHSQLDEWQATALLSSVGERPWGLLSRLKSLLDSGSDNHLLLLEKLTAFTVKSKNATDAESLAAWIKESRSPNRLALAASFVEALPPRERARAPSRLGGIEIVSAATIAATNSAAPLRVRLASVRFLAAADCRQGLGALDALLRRDQIETLQIAAARALLECDDARLAQSAFDQWPACSRAARRQMIASSVRHNTSALVLLASVEANKISALEIDPGSRQALQKSNDANVKERAEKWFISPVASDREAVVKSYGGAVELDGDRKRGAATFERICVVCHQMQGVGAQVGPDLSGIGTHSKDTLLVDILDPSRQVLPDFISYTAISKAGDVVTGYIANESPKSVTLRRPNEPDFTVQRADLKELKTESKSLMPDGLEAGLTIQYVADLLEFLRRPDRTLFSAATQHQ